MTVNVYFPRELAAVALDALLDQAAAYSRDAHAMRAGSNGQRLAAERATLCTQAARLVTLARASQDEDSGIGPLVREAS